MKTLRKTSARYSMAGFIMGCVAFGALTLNAQVIGGHNSNAPVNFGADRIELQDRQNRVVLTGNVDITQAGLRLRAPRTLINYTDAGSLKIQRIMASGGVQVTRGGEAASGDVAVYDFNRRLITMSGNVRLRRGGDTLNGGRLTIDLRTGISSVDGRGAGTANVPGTSESSSGRVTGSFTVPEN